MKFRELKGGKFELKSRLMCAENFEAVRTLGSNRSSLGTGQRIATTLWQPCRTSAKCLLFCLPNTQKHSLLLSVHFPFFLLPLFPLLPSFCPVNVLMLRPSRFIKLKTANFVAKVIHQKAFRLEMEWACGIRNVECGTWAGSADADPLSRGEGGRCKES